MLSAENLLELLQVLPDDKRKKLLLNSKLKKYSIDGYRTLKNVPIKVLSTYAAKSSLFCQIFLDLIIDEYNNLTTKDSQTFAVDEYPGILAYYFKYGMDIAPIKIRYEALTVPIKIEKESSQQEVEKVGNDMTMKKYLGYVLKQNYYYYNFYPVYVFDNKIEKITSPVVDFPQKGNINLFSQPHAQHKCADVFQENQVALIEFSQNDLLENRRGEQLNQTEKKLDVDELYNRNRIHFLRDIDLFPVVHLAAKLDFSGASNLVLEDNIQNSEDVLVEEDSTLYGPYKLDSNHQIKVSKSQNGTIQCWHPRFNKSLDECFLTFESDVGKYVFRSQLQIFHKDVLSDEELLQGFARVLKDKKDIDSPEKVVNNYLCSVFSDVDSSIREERKEKILKFIEGKKAESQYSKEIASVVAGLFAEYGDNGELRSVLESALDDSEFSSRIQSLDIVRDKVKNEQGKLLELQKEIENAQKIIEDATQKKKSEGINNENQKRIEELTQQVEQYEKIADLKSEIYYLERKKEDVAQQIKNYKGIEAKVENAITEKFQNAQSVNGVTDIAFDGMLAEKMLQAASTWRIENSNDNYKKLAEITTSDIWTNTDLNVADFLVNNVQLYRPTYTRNDILNISICIAQNFLTVFSGDPGTGKTSICNIFAHILGLTMPETSENKSIKKAKENYYINRYVAVSVERGWTSKRDFIGYYNPLSKQFEAANKQLCDGLRILNQEGRASKYPFVVLLDEANLSPMEYYWADFMNACDLDSVTKYLELGKDFELKIPQTLRFVATINNDHTTELLSPRLLDRAFIITLPNNIYTNFVEVDFRNVPSQAVTWSQFTNVFGRKKIDEFSDIIKEIYEKLCNALRLLNLRISPRSEKAIRMYWTTAQKLFEAASDGTDPPIVALDYAFAQKVLPQINGSGENYGNNLVKLENLFKMNHFSKCASIIEDICERGRNSMNYYQYF